jgi:hypothetical protein
MDQVTVKIPRLSVREGSAFTATAYFRDRATAASSTPTSAKYRVDCLTTRKQLTDWTALTPAGSIEIAMAGTHSDIQDDSNQYERKQLTVAGDYGLATQVMETATWQVVNAFGS